MGTLSQIFLFFNYDASPNTPVLNPLHFLPWKFKNPWLKIKSRQNIFLAHHAFIITDGYSLKIYQIYLIINNFVLTYLSQSSGSLRRNVQILEKHCLKQQPLLYNLILLLARAIGIPVGPTGTTLVATIFIIRFSPPPFFSFHHDLFSKRECLEQKTYLAKVDRNAQKPRGRHLSRPPLPFWGLLAAILDFAGGAALQAVSERPLRR